MLNAKVLALSAVVFCLSGCVISSNVRKPSIPMSAWVWDWHWASKSVVDNFEAYSHALLDLCENRNIMTLYMGTDFPIPEEKKDITAKLLERLHKRGISVEASACEARSYNGISLAHPGGEQGAYDYMSGVLAWNLSHPKSQWFDGVHFDVEEYTGTWLDVLRKLWNGDTLKQLKKMNASFKMGVVAVPAIWWGTEERRQEYGYKLQDYTDYVAVMSYFLKDRTLNFFTGPSKPALDYAAKKGKKINIGLEVSEWPGEGNNYAGWEYMSFMSQGEDELLYRINRINTILGKSAGFGGVIIQSSDSYQRLYLAWKEIDKDRRIYGKVDDTAEPITGKTSTMKIGDFSTRKHNSAEDTAVKTSMAVFNINPSITPGQVMTFNVMFGEYSDNRLNPLTDERVPAELVWFGFLDFVKGDLYAEYLYRLIRIDYNGTIGIRVVNNEMSGVPGDWKLLRISHDRFKPQAGKTYEYRLYFFSDSRVMVKIIDPDVNKVVWHSGRMLCNRQRLGSMYVEVIDKQPWGSIVYNKEKRVINLYKGDTLFATISNMTICCQ